jgi:hypothetical protein
MSRVIGRIDDWRMWRLGTAEESRLGREMVTACTESVMRRALHESGDSRNQNNSKGLVGIAGGVEGGGS